MVRKFPDCKKVLLPIMNKCLRKGKNLPVKLKSKLTFFLRNWGQTGYLSPIGL